MFALLIAPTVWSGYSVMRNTESSAPNAGPSVQASTLGRNTNTRVANNARGAQNAFGQGSQTNAALIAYLRKNQGNTKFLVAVVNAGTASPIILAVNKPVMALGGFSGNDPILTVNDLQTLISNGTIRYFLLAAPRAASSQQPNFGGGRGGSSAVTNWVTSNCSVVPTSALQTSKKRVSLGNNQLYDCAPAH